MKIRRVSALVITVIWTGLAFCVYSVLREWMPVDLAVNTILGVLGAIAIISFGSHEVGRIARLTQADEIGDLGPYELSNLDALIHQAYALLREKEKWLPALNELEQYRMRMNLPVNNKDSFEKPKEKAG